MAKFFTSAKIFVRNIVHFLLDELCTTRMFRLTPPRTKQMDMITIQDEKKLWTFPKTSVRLMSSCQHFCMQSRQYFFTKPLGGLTAVRSCRNLIFRRYCYTDVNLPVSNSKEKDKKKGNDEKVIKYNEQSNCDDLKEIKEKLSQKRNMIKPTPFKVKDLTNDDNLLHNNLYNSTQDVEIVGADDVVNLPNDNVNRLPLNLQNLINEVEIETQVFSEFLNDTHEPKVEKATKSVDTSPPFIKSTHKIPDLNYIPKSTQHVIPKNNKQSWNTKNKNEPIKVNEPVKGNVNEPVRGNVNEPVKGNVNEPVTTSNHKAENSIKMESNYQKKPLLDPPKSRALPKLSIKEIQNLAKKMCAMHVPQHMQPTINTENMFKKSINITKKPKKEEVETKSKIPINKTHTVDGFSKIPTKRLPKVDVEHNPVIVERKHRMEMIKKTLENVHTVVPDSVDELKTMSSVMFKDPKAPTLLSIASRNRYSVGENVTSTPIKPLPFRIPKDANPVIMKDQIQKNNVINQTKSVPHQSTLTSEDIRKKFNPLTSTVSANFHRSTSVPLYATNIKRQASFQISKTSEEEPQKSRLPLPETFVQKMFSLNRSSSTKSDISTNAVPKEHIRETRSAPMPSNTSQQFTTNQKPKSNPEAAYDNMTRNMEIPPRNSWSYLLSHKKQISPLKQSKRFCSSISGYDSDFSNDTETGGFDQDDMNHNKEDDYNMIEVKVKRNLPYLQSHRPDSSINLTGLVDRSIAQELRMREIDDRSDKPHNSHDVNTTMDPNDGKTSSTNEVVITTGTSNASSTDDPEFDSVRGIYCNQILCPTTSDVLTRYMNFSSQTESEDLKTKIKCMTSENKELVQDINNNDNNKS